MSDSAEARDKAAALFGTNSHYVSDAKNYSLGRSRPHWSPTTSVKLLRVSIWWRSVSSPNPLQIEPDRGQLPVLGLALGRPDDRRIGPRREVTAALTMKLPRLCKAPRSWGRPTPPDSICRGRLGESIALPLQLRGVGRRTCRAAESRDIRQLVHWERRWGTPARASFSSARRVLP